MSTLPPLEPGSPQTNSHGDRYFPALNPRAFQEHAASEVFRLHFGKGAFKEYTLHLICGTDSGLLLHHLSKRTLPEGARFLFVEYPEVIERLGETLDLEALLPGTVMCGAEELPSRVKEMEFEHHFFTNRLSLMQSVATADPTNRAYARLAHETMQQVNQLVLQLSSQLQTKMFLIQILLNAPESRVPIHSLDGCFSERTAVLVGGGPSLDTLLPWIRRHRERIDLLAVSRVSRRLGQVNLAPDLVFSIDPQMTSLALGREMFEFWPHSLFVYNTHACSALVGQWRGRSAYWGPRYPWDTWPKELPGSTVTHLALATAIDLGYTQVILAGVDLCFGRDGYTHAQGSIDRDIGPNVMRGSLEVTTNSGELAETDQQMYRGIREMEVLVAQAVRAGCRVLNPAPDAARMEGVEYLPTEHIELPDTAKPAWEILQRILPPDTPASRQADCAEQLEILSVVRRQLQQIKRHATRGIELNRKLFQARDSSKGWDKLKHKTEQVQKKLRSSFPSLLKTLTRLEAATFFEILRPQKETWEAEWVSSAGAKVFESYLDSSQELLRLLDETVARFRARAEEEKEGDSGFDLLLDQWSRDGQPGRTLIWADKHPGAAEGLPEPTARRFEELRDQYQATVTADATVGVVREVGFDRVVDKALAAFHRGDRQAIDRLASGLDSYPNDPEAVASRELVKGFLHELGEDYTTALGHYRRAAVGPQEKASDEATARSAACSILQGDLDNALKALQPLSIRRATYAPQYANLLRLAGRYPEAIDTYTTYLGENPQDLETMIKLGELYRQLGKVEGAQLALDYVLHQQPDHPTARGRLGDGPTSAGGQN